jgi:hypothetical protein
MSLPSIEFLVGHVGDWFYFTLMGTLNCSGLKSVSTAMCVNYSIEDKLEIREALTLEQWWEVGHLCAL